MLEGLFEEYCNHYCSDKNEKQYYSGNYCPNCSAMSYDDWLMDRNKKEKKEVKDEALRKPTVENKYNLTFNDISNLKILDRSQICKPLFRRNDVVNAWCIYDNTIKTPKDSAYCTYNEYWLGIYDEDREKIKVRCSSYGGMCGYKFNKFFSRKSIENEHDLEIQEKLLSKINELIDKGILGLREE